MGGCDVHRALIREASNDDGEAIVALWRDCGLTRPWNDPASDYTLAISNPTSTILVAEIGEGAAVLGSAMVGFDGHRGWVYYVAVAPDARRAGLGRALMVAAEQWLRARNVPKIQLMVRDDNQAARRFYQALGLAPQNVVTLGRFLED